MNLGASAQFEKTVSEADVALYLGLSGDELPGYLMASSNEPRLAPSTIALGYISSAFSLLTAGPPQQAAFVTRYHVTFPAPIHVGETLTTSVIVADATDSWRDVAVKVTCVTDDGRLVVDGLTFYHLA